jgi:hypothetical protein
MCQDRSGVRVRVRIPASLSCTGRAKWKRVGIDRCIAPIVKALQEGGINMEGSCCGHDKTVGNIALADGRVLFIVSPDAGQRYLAESGPERERIWKALTGKSLPELALDGPGGSTGQGREERGSDHV